VLDVDVPGASVVVVLADPRAVDDVLVLPTAVVVVDDELEVVDVVLVVVVGLDVVVVVVGSVGAGLFSKIFSTVVPPPECPNRFAKGRPAISSTRVTNTSETTKTAATRPATAGHRRPGVLLDARPSSPCAISGCPGLAPSVVSSPWAALVAGGSPVVSACVTPAASVPPSRWSNLLPSGTRTTTCLTAAWVRSIDWNSNAVPTVAATEPMATPTMVPFTPKIDAMTADNTAPPAEARICR